MKDNSYGVMLPFTRTRSPRWRSAAGGILIVLAAFGLGATSHEMLDARLWRSSAPGARDALIDPALPERDQREAITILLRDATASIASLQHMTECDSPIGEQSRHALSKLRDKVTPK